MKTNFTVTQNGNILDKSKYTWDEDTKTFSTTENNLVLDFNDIDNCTFKTGYNCTFKTGSYCTFKTGSYCTFKTGYNCTFNTGSHCIFKTSSNCTFNTGSYCTFNTGYNCTFNTGYNCTFKTSSNCTFKTSSDCTFDTGYNCTFDTGYNCTFNTSSNCVVIRRDVYEVIELEKGKKIKLNNFNKKGFTYIEDKKIITIDGKDIEISNESFEELKKQLI